MEKYITVSTLTNYLKNKFDTDDNLRLVYLKGEISNFKNHTSGHLYFSIKDEKSKINAIMFNSSASKLAFTPKEGTKILAIGRISIYEATGNYQIYVEEMVEDGVGNLYLAFEKLKQQLEKEGLFSLEHKKKIPTMPMRIGVVTAPTGAAIKDILSTIKRRFPLCDTYLFPCLVQGNEAAKDIVEKIKLADDYNLDVIIVGRGGGSIEDLWPFNDEIVARAIYNAKTPIISAVGHEIDYTISDYVSDLRAPTPTGAGELAVPNINDLIVYLNQINIRLNESIRRKVNYNKLILDSIKNSFILKNPIIIYENKKQLIDSYNEKINTIINHKLEMKRMTIDSVIDKLTLLNPLNILKRGYSIVYLNDKVINSTNKLKVNDELNIQLSHGKLETKIIRIEGEEK